MTSTVTPASPGLHHNDSREVIPLFVLLAAHFAIGLLLIAAGGRLGRRAFVAAGLVPLVAFVWGTIQLPDVLDGRVVRSAATWIPELSLSLDLRLDAFASIMFLLVTGIGTLVLLYATRYFGAATPGLPRLAGLLLIFTGAMLGVVTASNLLVLFVAWELTSISSYLLIGWDDTNPVARSSALQALLTTGAGGLALLGGFVLIGEAAGTYDIAALATRPPTGTSVSVGLVLVLIGAFTKSGQFPFSAWLPGAMVAPTPISAFLHSATMVKAGVYLIARLAPTFAGYGVWRPLVLGVGLVTMLTGGYRALREHDLKSILAFGTVSQLGFMVVLFGAGLPEATYAGVVVLVAHALFKAALFLIVGVIDHQAHTRDIRALGRFGPGWDGPRVAAIIAGASMAGIPLCFGFVAKEAAYTAFAEGEAGWSGLVLVGIVAGSMLTVAYTARLLLGAFTRELVSVVGVAQATVKVDAVVDPPAPAPAFWAPAGLLATLTLVIGVVPGLLSRLVSVAAASLDGVDRHEHLALWHGWTTPLLLTAVTFAVGALLVVRRLAVGRVLTILPRPVSGQQVYQSTVKGLNRMADRVTSVVQPGSLPIYLGVILLTLVVVPGIALAHSPFPDLPPLTTGPGDWAAAGLIIAGGVAATIVQERISAVLCLGAVGFGMALVFILQGAPDLALTQVCIDTLGAVIFVLVLRRLPNRFSDRATTIGRTARLAVSAAVGVFVFVFIVVAVGVRTEAPVSDQFTARSLEEGGGRNVVNVVIVDFRGFDTMGEITVLSIAGLGVYGLARLARRESRELRAFSPLRPLGFGRRREDDE